MANVNYNLNKKSIYDGHFLFLCANQKNKPIEILKWLENSNMMTKYHFPKHAYVF